MATTPTGPELTKGARITGDSRQALGAQLAERYQAGASIRALAQETGRSFGFVHGVIKESGVPLRGRGGATRRSAPSAVVAAAPAETPQALATADKADHPAKPGKSRKPDSKKTAKKDEPKKSAAKKEKAAGKKKGRS